METLQDRELLAEAARTRLEINPVSGERVQAIVAEVYQTPKAVTTKVAEMVR